MSWPGLRESFVPMGALKDESRLEELKSIYFDIMDYEDGYAYFENDSSIVMFAFDVDFASDPRLVHVPWSGAAPRDLWWVLPRGSELTRVINYQVGMMIPAAYFFLVKLHKRSCFPI